MGYWDDVARSYDGLYESPWSAFEDDIQRSRLRPLLDRSGPIRVLDIGCGTGLGYELAKSISDDLIYVGVDSSSGMLSVFKEKHPNVELYCMDASLIIDKFGDANFSVVLGLNTAMSYCGDPFDMLMKVKQVLRPGGEAYLSYLHRYSLRRIVRWKCGKTEVFSTRGAPKELGQVESQTICKEGLLDNIKRAGMSLSQMHYQSVLGGVYEGAAAIPVERLLSRMFPKLGHSISVRLLR